MELSTVSLLNADCLLGHTIIILIYQLPKYLLLLLDVCLLTHAGNEQGCHPNPPNLNEHSTTLRKANASELEMGI